MFSSIRSKLIAILFILGVVPLLIVGYGSYQSASQALLKQTKEQLGNLAAKTAQQVDNVFMVTQKDIVLLSNFPFIQLSFLQFEFGQRLDTARRLLEDYRRKNQYCNQILLVNLDGRIILSDPLNPEVVNEDVKSTDWFRQALQTDIRITDLLNRQNNISPQIIITKKVYDFENSAQPVGILVFDIKLSSFTRYVASVKIGSRGYAFLLNKAGYLIYHPDKDLIFKRNYLDSGDHKLRMLIEKMRSGTSGYGEYRFNEIQKYMVFAPCQQQDWSVGITVHRSELMADIYSLRRRIVTFICIIFGLILPVSFLFVRSMIRPIRNLITGARAIGSGDLDQRIHIRSSNELQSLAREFNKMAKQLKHSLHEILELKIFNEDILRSVSSGIISVDRQGMLTSFNRSAETLLGYSWNPTQQDAEKEIPGAMKQILELLKETLNQRKRIQNQELEFRRGNDDKVLYVEVNTSLLRSQEARLIGAIADIQDITRRKHMEALMVRVDKLASLGELSAGIAHEIRNPLAGMKTSAQVLANKIGGNPEKILIQGILSEIERLDKILTEMLNFARPSTPIFTPVDVLCVLEKSQDLLAEKLKKAKIDLIRKDSPELPLVLVDSEQIQQVFLNLLLNAIKAMPYGGKLIITVFHHHDLSAKQHKPAALQAACLNGFVAVTFKDTGHGIAKEHLSKAFNPFYTTDPGGTGLGLSIVHKLLEENHGFIHIESEPGKGSRVEVLLPVANNRI